MKCFFNYSYLLEKLQETFADYTACTSFERPLLSGVAYAERVVHSERESFERQHGWTIKTMEKDPSPVRDEYAPVIFSQETVSYIESLDMMSGEVLILLLLFLFLSNCVILKCLVFGKFEFGFHSTNGVDLACAGR